MEEVNIIRKIAHDKYYMFLITKTVSFGGNEEYTVIYPQCHLSAEDVVKVYQVTSKYNITMYKERFTTLEKAIDFASDGNINEENVLDVDVHEALLHINHINDVIAYKKCQKNK